MGKKKNAGGEKVNSAPTPKVEEDPKQTNRKEDPVSRLKESMQRLSEGMKQLGLSLGAETATEPTSSSQPVTNGYVTGTTTESTDATAKPVFERPEMTAEEKKAQRAAKAAEKKERAQAAAAKKSGAADPPNNSTPKGKAVEKKPNPSSGPKGETANKNSTPSPVDDSQPKSALKQTGVKSLTKLDGAGVKFDLTPSIVKSGSEEDLSIRSALPSPSILDYCVNENIHPSFLTLAMRSELDLIVDLDQLCREFVVAFKEFLLDWVKKRDSQAELKTMAADLGQAIKPQLAHLTQNSKWPLPFALGNIVRLLKKAIAALYTSESSLSQFTVEDLQYWLDECLRSNFDLAYEAISKDLREKLRSTPSVLIYDWCPVINKVLNDAFANEETRNIRCTVVDSEMNGKAIRHVQSFLKQGVRCRYTDLKSVGYAMQDVKMVLIGCSAVLSNGCIVAPKGSIQIALIAKAFNVPLLVVSQSFKFIDKALTYGRMALMGRETTELVPQDLITAIVTDIRILHPSSAPAVLKAKALEQE